MEKGDVIPDEDISMSLKMFYNSLREAGMEYVAMFPYLKFIDSYLESQNLPSIILPELNSDVPRHSGDQEEQLEKIIQHFIELYHTMTSPQKCVVMNCAQEFQNLILGLLVATNNCTEENFAHANMAPRGYIRALNDNISEEEEQKYLDINKSQFKVFENFLKYS